VNKKGYMITPIIFVVFMIIAVIFSFYVSEIDLEMTSSIQTSSRVEKEINNVYEARMNQLNYAKLVAYNQSYEYGYCYNASKSNNGLIDKIDEAMDAKYGEFDWVDGFQEDSQGTKLELNFPEIVVNKTDIILIAAEITTKELLSNKLLDNC
jgi:hypothetical protein